jgi:vancomycin resistance protein YoaR
MNSNNPPKIPFLRQIASALLIGLGVIVILSILFTVAVKTFYHNRVLPGVTLNGISLGGLTYDDAAVVISKTSSFPQSGRIVLQDGENNWMVNPEQMGFTLNVFASAQNALSIGQNGSVFTRIADTLAAVFYGYSASPTFLFDENQALQYLVSLSAQIDQPMQNAGLRIENSQVVITHGQPGRALDISSSLAAISDQIRKMQDGVVELVVIEEQPKILDVSAQSEQVKEILSQPFILNMPADQEITAGPWTIEPADLARMLTFTEEDNNGTTNVSISVIQPMLTGYLNTIESDVDLAPDNARFIFNDDTRQLDLYKPATIGRTLDINNSVQAITTAILGGSHAALLQLTLTQPEITDDVTAANLGITELITQQSTYFRGSSQDRIQNIQTGAEKFMGVLIAPGVEVSMAEILGDISLDNGYAEAPIILGDQTIQGVGGGICQVSTTLFRTVLYAGYPILERHAHSYRVGYYEQNASGHDQNLAGMDATVFVPIVDFRFANDSDHWLLMETYVNTSAYRLTWKFYSTSDGREVSITTPKITDIVEPGDPIYRENGELTTGTIKQVEYQVDGATATFDRVVTRNGQTIDSDHFVTHYDPWQAVYEYGPGTEGIPSSSN